MVGGRGGQTATEVGLACSCVACPMSTYVYAFGPCPKHHQQPFSLVASCIAILQCRLPLFARRLETSCNKQQQQLTTITTTAVTTVKTATITITITKAIKNCLQRKREKRENQRTTKFLAKCNLSGQRKRLTLPHSVARCTLLRDAVRWSCCWLGG